MFIYSLPIREKYVLVTKARDSAKNHFCTEVKSYQKQQEFLFIFGENYISSIEF